MSKFVVTKLELHNMEIKPEIREIREDLIYSVETICLLYNLPALHLDVA